MWPDVIDMTVYRCYFTFFPELWWSRILKEATTVTGQHIAANVNVVFDGQQKPAKRTNTGCIVLVSACEREG